MIIITQLPAKKVIGETSLYVTFDFSQRVIDLIKYIGDYVYHNDTREWELPLTKLATLIDVLTYEDDISLSLINEKDKERSSQVLNHKISPFDYQSEDIDWLLNHNNGLILNPPGLGKTLEIIYTAEELKAQKGIEHCLIICGINTLKQNWKREIEKFSTETCRVVGEKINSKGKLVYASVKERAEELYNKLEQFFIIINIESLRDDTVLDAIRNSKNHFDMIVVDECHKCKAPSTSQGKALKKLSKVGKYHYGLTGTVLVNSPLDAYMPLNFIGVEKSSYSNFKAFYCNLSMAYGHYQIDGYRNLDYLKSILSECSIRRDKSILNLPSKIIVPEIIELDAEHKKFYDDINAGVVAEADKVNIKTTTLLGLVTRLRQAATIPESLTSKEIQNAKLERVKSLVEEITSSGEQVIVFSAFKDPLYKLKDILSDYKPLLCTGDQTDEEISTTIDNFQDGENKVILCTASKMGTGITLTAASYEIFLDSNWTAALEEQAEDRAWRIGTKKSVIIYKLIAAGTIDERIQNILERKRAISDYIVDDKVTNEVLELRELLGLMS